MKEYSNRILKVYEIHFFNLTNPFGQKAGSGGKEYRRASLPARPPSSPPSTRHCFPRLKGTLQAAAPPFPTTLSQ